MKGTTRIAILLIGIFVVLSVVIYLVAGTPGKTNTETLKPVNWVENYDIQERSPYGLHVFSQIISEFYKDLGKKRISVDEYNNAKDASAFGPVIIFEVSKSLYYELEDEQNFIRFIASGNYAFLSAESFPALMQQIVDSRYRKTQNSDRSIRLHFEEQYLDPEKKYPFEFIFEGEKKLHDWHGFEPRFTTELLNAIRNNPVEEESEEINNLLEPETALEPELSPEEILSENPEETEEAIPNLKMIGNTDVLEWNDKGKATLIRIDYGEGAFFFQTVPIAFTNISLLKEQNIEHLEKTLSCLPDAHLLYHAPESESSPDISSESEGDGLGGGGSNPTRNSPLEFILKIPALRWAYYLALISLLLFVLFKMKRRQKPIPAKEKNENSTMDFAQTVSQVYYQQGKHLHLVRHMERLLFSYIRDRYFIIASKADEKFIRSLAAKTQLPEEKLSELFLAFENTLNQKSITDAQFIELHRQTEYFYKNCK